MDQQLKVGVKYALLSPTEEYKYIAIARDPSEDLIERIVKHCAELWNLPTPADADKIPEFYSLRFDKSNLLITRENINVIQTGVVLKLTYSTQKMVQVIVDNLKTHEKSGAEALLSQVKAQDREFLDLFIQTYDGISVILNRYIYSMSFCPLCNDLFLNIP